MDEKDLSNELWRIWGSLADKQQLARNLPKPTGLLSCMAKEHHPSGYQISAICAIEDHAKFYKEIMTLQAKLVLPEIAEAVPFESSDVHKVICSFAGSIWPFFPGYDYLALNGVISDMQLQLKRKIIPQVDKLLELQSTLCIGGEYKEALFGLKPRDEFDWHLYDTPLATDELFRSLWNLKHVCVCVDWFRPPDAPIQTAFKAVMRTLFDDTDVPDIVLDINGALLNRSSDYPVNECGALLAKMKFYRTHCDKMIKDKIAKWHDMLADAALALIMAAPGTFVESNT